MTDLAISADSLAKTYSSIPAVGGISLHVPRGLADASPLQRAPLFGSEGFSIALRIRWHINVPVPTMRIGSLPPVISDLLWILIALSFIFAAQLAVERAEI